MGYYIDASYRQHAFVDANGMFSSFDYPGGPEFVPSGVNSAALVVGGYYDGKVTRYSYTYGNGAFSPIVAPGATSTYAEGINESGQVVGYAVGNAGGIHGFLGAGGGFSSLDYPGATSTYSNGISSSGSVVGTYDVGSQPCGYLFSGGAYRTIPCPGNPLDVKALGQVVESYTDGQRGHGYVWRDGAYAAIDVPGASGTAAPGINDSGRIVGHYYDGAGYKGFVATPYPVRTDPTGDGRSDVLFRTGCTGDLGYVPLTGAGQPGGYVCLGGSNAAYSVVGTGDYDGNGVLDVLFRAGTGGIRLRGADPVRHRGQLRAPRRVERKLRRGGIARRLGAYRSISTATRLSACTPRPMQRSSGW